MAPGEIPPTRRRLNQDGYGGRQVPIDELLHRITQAATAKGWRIDEFCRQADWPVWQLTKSTAPSTGSPQRVYISAGIHGDEPATSLAAVQLLEEDQWAPNMEIVLFPCLNPFGIAESRREGPEGIDFNRDYRSPRTALVKAHCEWLRDCTAFDVALLLHEDWEADGFYLYELRAPTARSAAHEIVSAFSETCPIFSASQADGWPVVKGIVRPAAGRSPREGFPEAFYLFLKKVDLCYTFEAPSDYDLAIRVHALVGAVRSALKHCGGSEVEAGRGGDHS